MHSSDDTIRCHNVFSGDLTTGLEVMAQWLKETYIPEPNIWDVTVSFSPHEGETDPWIISIYYFSK